MERPCPRCGASNESDTEFCSNCEFPLAESSALIKGRYRIIKPYVFSCFRAVYQAEDIKNNNRICSIREFLPQFFNAGEKVMIAGRFNSLLTRMSELQHNKMAGVIDYFQEGPYYYVVYDYVNGLDLPKYVESHKILTDSGYPERLVSLWGLQMCELLEYFHHGFDTPHYMIDLKPVSVVFRQEDENIVFIDTGLFMLLQLFGPHFLITEDFQSYRKAYGKYESIGWDLFCLGNLLFYLLTGIDLMHSPLHLIDSLADFRPDISPQMVEIVTKAVGKLGCSYYTDVRDIKRDLEEKVPPLPLRAFDFYSDFVDIKKTQKKTQWTMLLGNKERTGCIGPAPRPPLKLKWKIKLKPSKQFFLSASDDYVYVISSEGMLYGIDKDGSDEIWRFYICKNIPTPGIAYENTIYQVTPRQELAAITRGASNFLWKNPLESSVMSTPTYYDDILYLAMYNGKILAVNPVDGRVLTTYQIDGNVISSPIIYNNILFISSLNKKICAINIDTEDILWTYETETGFSASPTLINNCLIVGSHDGTLCAIDTEEGTLRWRKNFQGAVTQSVRAVADMVYLVTRAGMLIALNPYTGKICWHEDLGDFDFEYPFCLGTNTLFIVDSKKNLRCIDAFDGREKFRLNMSHPTASQLMIAHSQIYLVSQSGHLAALGR